LRPPVKEEATILEPPFVEVRKKKKKGKVKLLPEPEVTPEALSEAPRVDSVGVERVPAVEGEQEEQKKKRRRKRKRAKGSVVEAAGEHATDHPLELAADHPLVAATPSGESAGEESPDVPEPSEEGGEEAKKKRRRKRRRGVKTVNEADLQEGGVAEDAEYVAPLQAGETLAPEAVVAPEVVVTPEAVVESVAPAKGKRSSKVGRSAKVAVGVVGDESVEAVEAGVKPAAETAKPARAPKSVKAPALEVATKVKPALAPRKKPAADKGETAGESESLDPVMEKPKKARAPRKKKEETPGQ
jgi:ribonuclease E